MSLVENNAATSAAAQARPTTGSSTEQMKITLTTNSAASWESIRNETMTSVSGRTLTTLTLEARTRVSS